MTARQVHDWHAVKDSKGGPTLAGSPGWKNYLELLEKELRQSGVVDSVRHPFTYTRWHTTERPDDANWSLHVDGKKIKVASYGANSGATPDAGATQRSPETPGRVSSPLTGAAEFFRAVAVVQCPVADLELGVVAAEPIVRVAGLQRRLPARLVNRFKRSNFAEICQVRRDMIASDAPAIASPS